MPIFDTEMDGFNPTKIYVLSYYDEETKSVKSLTDYKEMISWINKQEWLIGHNIFAFDFKNLEKILGIKIKAKKIDTLALSWYLYPSRKLHGLEWWGEDLGILKVEIEDWFNLPVERYIERCEQDVRINQRLWELQQEYLSTLYEVNDPLTLPIIRYLEFKMACVAKQEEIGWEMDKEWVEDNLNKLLQLKEPQFEALKAVMPKVIKYMKKSKPSKPFKKDGTWSVHGAKWFSELERQGFPNYYDGEIEVEIGEEEPNPDSPEQVKNWLFSLGWEPMTFKFEKEEDGTERKIPQIKLPNSPDICPSVLQLAEENPQVSELEGLSILKHRIGLLKGFLRDCDNGVLRAKIHGLTNTLRLRHKEIVNLPGVDKPHGLEIRGSLVARKGHKIVGTDMVSLEDSTKRHYMYFYDPKYVEEMSDPSFDPHLDLAIFTKAISQEDLDYFKKNKKDEKDPKIKSITSLRKQYKIVNYSSVYGIGPPNLSRSLKSTVSAAAVLLESYWERNWSVKKVAEDCIVKSVKRQKWLYNPVSGFWYSLRAEKDRFSTLNQGTGVYCFDSWVKECVKRGYWPLAQFHDETVTEVVAADADKVIKAQQEAIDAVNKKLKLNVTLRITPKIGERYSDIH